MRTEQARPIRLQDYRPPDWLVETVELDVSLHPTATRVRATLALKPNADGAAPAPLVLDGDGLNLKSVSLDGAPLPLERYVATPDSLTIAQPPQRAVPRSRSRPWSIRRPTRSSWVSTARAAPTARSARRKASAASPISPTGRT